MNIKVFLKQAFNFITGQGKYPKKDFGSIGKHCIIGKNCALVPRNMFLEDYVIIQNRNNFISYKGKLIIKKYSVISSGCIIVPSTHLAAPGIPFYFQATKHYGDEDHTIIIEEDCWVGAGAILLPNCHLGRGTVVAAGSVVTKAFPPYAIIAGVPAKIVGVKFSKADIKLHESLIYPEEQRLSSEEIDRLFETFYIDLSPMKKCEDKVIEEYLKNHITTQ